ncbi:hypothetical protein BLNAU_6895 [Blattamonas nauphoetae]|uniref:Uncharacterized protein n=1 Tax=Blattamonas nauphoetae TaxID=2049346 RepID=A0ABQ9Y380_9EUKA|nr:hypothetical protein BLNAU_6895 [Blattamonas nauphoetae]
MDCSPFLNWDEEDLDSEDDQAVVFQALVATLKSHPTLDRCSAKVHLTLVKANMIPQLIHALNPHSLSFAEAVDIHLNLMKTIDYRI